MEKVYLNEEALPEIYHSLNRISKKEKYEKVKQFFLEFRANAVPLLLPLINKAIERLNNFESVMSIVDIDNLQQSKDCFHGLNELLKNRNEEISKRQWSIQLFNDSKRWETLEQKIISIIRKEIFPDYEGLDKATILGEFGIIENPKAIDIYGNCKMAKGGKEIDFSIDESGIGMYPSFFRSCVVNFLNVERILTIENKTSYYDYLNVAKRNNELIIYLGGYHNHVRTILLKKLYQFTQLNNLDIPFYYWGDIDYGGLSILINLRKKTNIPFRPFCMDVETYLANLQNGKKVKDKSYLLRLQQLLNNDDYKEFEDMINSILDNKITVEQESISLV